MKIYTLTAYGKDHPVTLELITYSTNKNLAIQIHTYIEGYPEPWSKLSVNLNHKLQSDQLYIDTNNNGPQILQWLEQNHIAKPLNSINFSGYCSYPLYQLTPEFIQEQQIELTDEQLRLLYNYTPTSEFYPDENHHEPIDEDLPY